MSEELEDDSLQRIANFVEIELQWDYYRTLHIALKQKIDFQWDLVANGLLIDNELLLLTDPSTIVKLLSE